MAAKNIYDLNDYCLIQIFKSLDTKDWVNLCATTKRFRAIVMDHVVNQELIEIYSHHANAPKIIKLFGQNVTKLCFNDGTLNEFFQMLVDYIKPGSLTHIELWNVHTEQRIDKDLLVRAAIVLNNVNFLICMDVNPLAPLLTYIPNAQIKHSDSGPFPNLINCSLCLPVVADPPNDIRVTEVFDFIKTKKNFKRFYCCGFENENVLKKIAENCANITAIGKIVVKCDGAEKRWDILKECQHIEKVAMRVNSFHHKEFGNIVDVLGTMTKLKSLYIEFRNEPGLDSTTFCKEIMSFLATKTLRTISISESIELLFDVDMDPLCVEQLSYIFATTFSAKLIILHQDDVEVFGTTSFGCIVRNMQNLEYIYIESDYFYDEQTSLCLWSSLSIEKTSVNERSANPKILTIFVDDDSETELKAQLGSLYNPDVISICSHSIFASKPSILYTSFF